jgi:hypothetical protein
MRQIEVINQETIIDVTAETSSVEILVRDYDSELVERFALEAQEAAIEAEESADIATAQASIATAQAGIATTQAGIATTQAGIATTQSGIATTKANEASASAASALASEQAADADRIAAQAAASTAATQAGIATTQAGIATTKAGEASDSAAAALASETDAETAASTATTQAGIATTQAQEAAASAQEAQDIVDSITPADLTEATSSVLTITGGTDAVLGSGTTIQVKQAGSSQSGFLSSTDWTTFNSKQDTITNPVTGTGESGQVAFWNGTSSQTGDNGLFWDNTNKRLGVGLNNPDVQFQVLSTLKVGQFETTNGTLEIASSQGPKTTFQQVGNNLNISNTTGAPIGSILFTNKLRTVSFSNDIGGTFRIPRANQGLLNSNVNGFFVESQTTTTSNSTATFISTSISGSIIRSTSYGTTGVSADINFQFGGGSNPADSTITTPVIFKKSGNILINTTTDAGFRLDVNGTARVQGVLTTTADAVVNGVNVGRGASSIVSNTRLGTNNLNNNSTGFNNTAVGYESGLLNTTGDNNSFFGSGSGRSNTTGSRNSFIGQDAGRSNTTGFGNSFFGQNAGFNTTSGGGNIAIGRDSLFTNNTGTNNIAIGTNSLINLTGTHSNNLAFGIDSGRRIADASNLTIANNSVFIGFDTRAAADNQTNQIVIGHNAIGLGSNTTVIGNSSTTFGRWFGNLLVGTSTNAGFALDVNGTARVQGRITNVAPAIAATRETLYRGSVSDNANDAFIIANGTSANSVFVPNFVGFNQSSQLLWGLGFTGLLTSTNDASDSSVFGIIRFNAARTDNAADPINGTFTSIANRKLFTFENNAVPVGTVFRTGNWLIENGGTATDVASAILNVNSTTQGFLPPRMTTTQKNAIASPATGLVVYDNTLNKLSVFTGVTWETVTSL